MKFRTTTAATAATDLREFAAYLSDGVALYCLDGNRGEFAPSKKGDRETLCVRCGRHAWQHWTVKP